MSPPRRVTFVVGSSLLTLSLGASGCTDHAAAVPKQKTVNTVAPEPSSAPPEKRVNTRPADK